MILLQNQPVPYAPKTKIEDELTRLVRLGIYEPIATSHWAAPIVPVFKKEMDLSVYVVIDYKQTVSSGVR